MTNLFEPPPRYTLPLTKGSDVSVDFVNDPANDGTTADYAAGVTVVLTIDTTPPTVAAADIDGPHAVIKIESDVADLIAADTTWRLIASTPTDPPTDIVAAQGKVRRYDS